MVISPISKKFIVGLPFLLIAAGFFIFSEQINWAIETILLADVSIVLAFFGFLIKFNNTYIAFASSRNTKFSKIVLYVVSLLSILSGVYITLDIVSNYGSFLMFAENADSIRLSYKIPVLPNIIQSFYFFSIPASLLTRSKSLLCLNIFFTIVYALSIGNRAPIIFVIYVLLLFSRGFYKIFFAIFAIFAVLIKGLLADLEISEYATVLLSSQITYFNYYATSYNELYYGYFSFLRPILSFFPGSYLALSDLQLTLLGVNFDGLLVATAFVYPMLDFGPIFLVYCILFFMVSIFILKNYSKFPIFATVFTFGYVMMYYDSFFNQAYFILILLFSMAFDIFARIRVPN